MSGHHTLCLSRRTILRILVNAVWTPAAMAGSASSDFWNSESPDQWTKEEVERLTTNSPWARPVSAVVPVYSADSGPTPGDRRNQRSGRGQSRPATPPPQFPGTVRWASAKPIQQALHLKLPAVFSDYYVISVSGLPVIGGYSSGGSASDTSPEHAFDALKQVTYLEIKRQDPINPGEVYQDPNESSAIYFGFLHQFLDFTSAKTATFSTSMGPLEVKVKFNLKEMKYHGELAV
ncbi:MAG: hypothetical protein WA324_24900 [Bryobacteraceae bacterium]